jgi:hypothetical protein
MATGEPEITTEFDPLAELHKSNARVRSLLQEFEDDSASASFFQAQLASLDKTCLSARIGENQDGLHQLGQELQAMIVTDPLLNENSQETGPIVEVLDHGENEIGRTMQEERMESVKR